MKFGSMKKAKKAPVLPEGLDVLEGAEINFVIEKFSKLPPKVAICLAQAIRNCDPHSDFYLDAGVKIFDLLWSADNVKLAEYMSQQFGEEVDDYLIPPEQYADKMRRFAQYFRDNLSTKPNTVEIEKIDLAPLPVPELTS